MGIPVHLTCLLRNLYAVQEATVRTGHGTTDWFQIRKRVCQVYCHHVYLTYVQSTSCKMPGWMKHKLESRLLGEISINLRYADDTTLVAESEEELKSFLMKVKQESGKAAFSSLAQLCPTLWDPHGVQHARLPCPSPSPGACSNSCPLSR